jgi:hypothetical protein
MAFFSVGTWSFLPLARVENYSPSPILGWVLLVAGLLPCVFLGKLDDRRRVLALTLLCAALTLLLHPYKLPRFLFIAVPLLFLSAASVLVALLQRLGGRLTVSFGTGTLIVMLALLPGATPPDPAFINAWRQRAVPSTVRPVVDRICELGAETESSILLGSWNLLSPGLVDWHFRQRYPRTDPSQAPQAWRLLSSDRSADEVLDTLRHRSSAELVLILDVSALPNPATAGFTEETAWLPPVRRGLNGAPEFVLEKEEEFPQAGYRLLMYRRSSSLP